MSYSEVSGIHLLHIALYQYVLYQNVIVLSILKYAQKNKAYMPFFVGHMPYSLHILLLLLVYTFTLFFSSAIIIAQNTMNASKQRGAAYLIALLMKVPDISLGLVKCVSVLSMSSAVTK